VTAQTAPRCICTKFTRENGWITRTCPEHDPLSEEQKDALRRHGYNPDHVPCGASGPPDRSYKSIDGVWLRYRVCELDGIEIEGHAPSDLDPLGPCLHCGKELWPEIDD
jgi:hypothetical protein